MNRFNISFLTNLYFYWYWQTSNTLSLVNVLMTVFDYVNGLLYKKETDYTQIVGYSAQRLSLEQSLNERFDSDLNRIEIKNGDVSGNDFLYNEDESISLSLFTYVFNEAETIPSGADVEYWLNENESGTGTISFTVFVPTEYASQENEIKAWIDRVKLLGTNYEIIYT